MIHPAPTKDAPTTVSNTGIEPADRESAQIGATSTHDFQALPDGTAATDGHGESRRRAWGLTGLLVSLYVINYAGKAVLGIIAQPLAEELGLKSSQIGLVGSLFFLTFTIGGFFAGLLNRWMTLRWALIILALCWAAAMLPLVAVASFAVLILSRLFLGLVEGPSSALLHTAAYSWHAPARRGLPGALLAGAASISKIAIAPIHRRGHRQPGVACCAGLPQCGRCPLVRRLVGDLV